MQQQKQLSLVKLANAGINRGGKWIVRDVSLDVHEGEIVTLIGPNGSGKSTTAKLVCGLLNPDEGNLWQRPDLKIGYVPQKLNIGTTLPLSIARLLSLAAPYTKPQINDALELVGIAHMADAQVQQLSGGEFQRALLARAIIGKPDLLVLDEPVQGVDYSGEADLYQLIGKIRDETACGILLISHDLHVVMAATDMVVCLNGHVCCTGPPQKVASSRQYAELFGKRAVDTLALYQHHHDHTHLPDGKVLHSDGSLSDHCYHDDGHHDNAG